MMGERLAKLIADPATGIVDIQRQTTYSMIGAPLQWQDTHDGLGWLYGPRPRQHPRLEYESIAIRLTGGFDD